MDGGLVNLGKQLSWKPHRIATHHGNIWGRPTRPSVGGVVCSTRTHISSCNSPECAPVGMLITLSSRADSAWLRQSSAAHATMPLSGSNPINDANGCHTGQSATLAVEEECTLPRDQCVIIPGDYSFGRPTERAFHLTAFAVARWSISCTAEKCGSVACFVLCIHAQTFGNGCNCSSMPGPCTADKLSTACRQQMCKQSLPDTIAEPEQQ